jgi:hypothetical protein
MKDGKTGPSHNRKKIHEIKECDAGWYNEGLLFTQHRINRMRCTLCSTHDLDYRCRTGCNIPPGIHFSHRGTELIIDNHVAPFPAFQFRQLTDQERVWTLPDLLLSVAGGILSVAWFDLLKARLAGSPAGP